MSTLTARLTLSDFDYALPDELIAQVPAQERDRSRLLVLERAGGTIRHQVFTDLRTFLRAGDLLVLNDTRVFPCRIAARKSGGGKAEVFLLQELGINLWRALVRGSIDRGRTVAVAAGIDAEVIAVDSDGVRTLRFRGTPDIRSILPDVGRMPLPPYIRREAAPEDQDRYQTVYAAREGAVAAPTAGLHFTAQLLQDLQAQGVGIATVTLHVGPGTFRPVRTEDIALHHMHEESYNVPEETVERIGRTKGTGGRVIAVGTTTVRTLETSADQGGVVQAGDGKSSLFIVPGYSFKVIDGMITNFHLPKSTLLMLVAAFAGRERMFEAYNAAIGERYRFYSYGDAMLVL